SAARYAARSTTRGRAARPRDDGKYLLPGLHRGNAPARDGEVRTHRRRAHRRRPRLRRVLGGGALRGSERAALGAQRDRPREGPMNEGTVWCGIDPGTRNLGIAFLTRSATDGSWHPWIIESLSFKTEQPLDERLKLIHRAIAPQANNLPPGTMWIKYVVEE